MMHPMPVRGLLLLKLLLLLLFLFAQIGCGVSAAPPHTRGSSSISLTDLQAATLGVTALQQNWYLQDSGRWSTAGWWNDANAVTVLGLYAKSSGSSVYLPVIANVWQRNSGN